MKKIFTIGICASIFIAVLPVISLLLGVALSYVFGCPELNEAGAPDCFFGEGIYVLTMMMWFIFITVPVGVFFFILSLIGYLVCTFMFKK